jgi:hypothetical protein
MKPSALKTTQEYVGRFHELEAEKHPWLILYQALAEILLTRKMDFTRVIIPGQFLQADVFDNTGQFSAYLFASLFLSLMWPNAAKSFRLRPVKRLRKLPGVEEFFRWATGVMHEYMDKDRAGLAMALHEHFLDTGIFGTAGVHTEDNSDNDEELPLVYDAWGVKNMCIAETKQGYVDEVYYVRPLKVRQLVKEYSKKGDYIPARIAEKAKQGGSAAEEPVDVLVVIEPAEPEKNARGERLAGIYGMPVRVVHIALNEGARLRVDGEEEMPVAVGRLFKQLDEALGRSCGMLALPDAQSLNALTEGVLVATEKSLDPPLGVLDDGRLGGGVVDSSAGAISVFNMSGRQTNEKPVFQLQTIGEFQQALEQQKQFAAKIAQAFFLDRLLDLNNQTQMTAYETSVRDKIRGESVGGLFSRQEKEVFTPFVERSFNILFRRGYFGIVNDGPGARLRRKWDAISGAERVEVPAAVVQAFQAGLNVFEVEYISPAKRFQQAEELRGLLTALDTSLALAPVIPDSLDVVDTDDVIRKVFERTGAPIEVIRTMDALKKFRATKAQVRQQQQQLDQAEQGANIGLKSAQARSALGTTPAVPPAAVSGGGR